MSDEAVIQAARDFVARLKNEPIPTRHGSLAPAFQPLSTPTRLAWCSLVAGLLSSTRTYFPISPERHAVTVGTLGDRHTYTYEARPELVLSNARACGVAALNITLRAEAWAREIAVELDEKLERTEDEEYMFRVASGFANHLAKFHLQAWSIREPASLDAEQRALQAQIVVKRTINHPGYIPRARAAND